MNWTPAVRMCWIIWEVYCVRRIAIIFQWNFIFWFVGFLHLALWVLIGAENEVLWERTTWRQMDHWSCTRLGQYVPLLLCGRLANTILEARRRTVLNGALCFGRDHRHVWYSCPVLSGFPLISVDAVQKTDMVTSGVQLLRSQFVRICVPSHTPTDISTNSSTSSAWCPRRGHIHKKMTTHTRNLCDVHRLTWATETILDGTARETNYS